jgi:nitrate/nitrite-specific signal transduction histidine kinase
MVLLLLLSCAAALWMLQAALHRIDQLGSDPQLIAQRMQELSQWFRWLGLGLAIVFVLVINLAVVVLLRLGSTVLKPVGKLLAATRQLDQEHFDHRVHIDQHDEFDELGRAYNSLAEQLQEHERRRLETLTQTSVAMSHELNNAIAIIELQLAKLSRHNAGNAPLEQCLREIQHSLKRVTETVRALGNVRRIVLTDYVPGTKMLDLQRSIQAHEPLAKNGTSKT